MIFFRKRNMEIQQKQTESEQLLRTFAFLDLKDLYHHFSVPESGLDSRQAAQRQETYGKKYDHNRSEQYHIPPSSDICYQSL